MEIPKQIIINYNNFKDENGNIVNIEIRGKLNDKKSILIKVNDLFEKGEYNNEHIQNFIVYKTVDNMLETNVKKRKIESSYINYEGLKIYCNNNKNNYKINNFFTWLNKILKKLPLNKLGSSYNESLKHHFNICSNNCGLYFIIINTVENLKKGCYDFNFLPNTNKDKLLCKFGCSRNILERIKKHQQHFGNNLNNNINVFYIGSVDEQFIYKAETDLKNNYLSDYLLKNDTYKELVIMDIKEINKIKQIYNSLSEKYSSNSKNLIKKNKELEHTIELNNKNYQNDILKYENNNLILNNLIEKNKELKNIIELNDKKYKKEKKILNNYINHICHYYYYYIYNINNYYNKIIQEKKNSITYLDKVINKINFWSSYKKK